MTMALAIAMRECFRPNGVDRLRINLANKHFGVGIVATATVRTFYIVPLHHIVRRKGIAPFFESECQRVDP
jgi:hypothetical protein